MCITTMDIAHLSYTIQVMRSFVSRGDSSRWDDKDKLKQRSAEWDKKYLMKQVTEDEFIKRLAEGKQIMVIVPKGEISHFKQSSIAPYVGEY